MAAMDVQGLTVYKLQVVLIFAVLLPVLGLLQSYCCGFIFLCLCLQLYLSAESWPWANIQSVINIQPLFSLYNCLHGTALRYLQDVIQPVAVTARRRLRSTSSSALVVPTTRRTTIRDRAFAVSGPRAWNSLPQFVTDCTSSDTFRKYPKIYLFSLVILEHGTAAY